MSMRPFAIRRLPACAMSLAFCEESASFAPVKGAEPPAMRTASGWACGDKS